MKLDRTRRRLISFRLRTLLILVTVLAIPLGWVAWELDQRRKEKVTIAWVEEMGGIARSHAGADISWWEKEKDKWFGESVTEAWLGSNPFRPKWDPKDFEPIQLGDLSPLEELKNLRHLDLKRTQVSEEQLQKLRQALPNLKIYYNDEKWLIPLSLTHKWPQQTE